MVFSSICGRENVDIKVVQKIVLLSTLLLEKTSRETWTAKVKPVDQLQIFIGRGDAAGLAPIVKG